MKRTHRCGELRPEDVGQSVVLMGWVRARRDHGKVIFLDLWDRTGVTQVVVDPNHSAAAHAVAHGLRDEYVIAVAGEVLARPRGSENPALATGAVEVAASALEVLNAAKPLPFPVDAAPDVDDTLRLRYRYLDLRRDGMLRNLRLRHRVVRAMRDALDAQDFVEVETPMLTRSTPEGARDYLVPSRVHAGEFYALPQSPQQMKQLLMVAGVDRYYQIARCFRDEDLRADRQPEFTQLDLEMSFVGQEEVLALVEAMMAAVIHQVQPGRKVVTPFPRMTYDEAIAQYGTDKPDLRWDMAFVEVTDLLGGSGVRIFHEAVGAGGVIKGIRVPGMSEASRADLDEIQALSREFGAEGVAWLAVDEDGVRASFSRYLTAEEVSRVVAAFEAMPGDLLLLVAGARDMVHGALDGLRREMGARMGLADPDKLALAWIVDFPLFKWDWEKRGWNAEHHPFTSPKPADVPLLETDPGAVRASCYDLVCNGWELGSGSIRIHRRELQERILGLLGYGAEEAEASFGHLMEAFEYGAPPHGGLAVGIDRLVAILAGTDTIRDVIAFPKTRQATDLLMHAPAKVDREQLDDVHIRLSLPKPKPEPVRAGD